jgi:hypothetical protein
MTEPRGWNFTETEGDWSIETVDPDAGTHAPDMRAVLKRNGETVREIEFPAYKVFTVLAHWRDWLPELESLSADRAPE